MQLITKIDHHMYKEAWSALVPTIWEFCSSLDIGDGKDKIEDDDVLDEGNLLYYNKQQHFSQIPRKVGAKCMCINFNEMSKGVHVKKP